MTVRHDDPVDAYGHDRGGDESGGEDQGAAGMDHGLLLSGGDVRNGVSALQIRGAGAASPPPLTPRSASLAKLAELATVLA